MCSLFTRTNLLTELFILGEDLHCLPLLHWGDVELVDGPAEAGDLVVLVHEEVILGGDLVTQLRDSLRLEINFLLFGGELREILLVEVKSLLDRLNVASFHGRI